MDTTKAMQYIFFSVMSGIGTIGVSYIHEISQTMTKLNDSIAELNIRMESISGRMVRADDALKDHESRLRQVEIRTR